MVALVNALIMRDFKSDLLCQSHHYLGIVGYHYSGLSKILQVSII